MKWHLRLLVVLAFLFSWPAPALWAQETQPGDSTADETYPVMRPDPETRQRYYQEYLNAPQSHIDPTLSALSASPANAPSGAPTSQPVPLLLDFITYTPSERSQGSCGNCYAWAGTALLEAKHSVENGVKDRLSIQWFNSASYDGNPKNDPCKSGALGSITSFYNSQVEVPWSNKNAYYQDGSWKNGEGPAIPASSISTNPNYSGSPNAFVSATIPTLNVSQETAIANIQNVLLQNKAVFFMFQLPTSAAWSSFKGKGSFWASEPESAIWDPDSFCGQTEDKGAGGHAVVIVGWDDSDPNPDNHYWIVLNSWGAPKNRPNGLFRMKMNMNYSCTEINEDGQTIYTRQFQNVETASGTTAFFDTNRLFMADFEPLTGAQNDLIHYTDIATGGSWSSISFAPGGTTDATPALATFNTRQYMAAKGATNNTITIKSVDPTGVWTSGTKRAGGNTDGNPALVMYRNKLYLFTKNAGKSTISYSYMDTTGAWSTWSTVPGFTTSHSPAAVVHNDQLHLLLIGEDGMVYLNSMQSDGSWVGWVQFPNMVTNAPAAAAVFQNMVYVVVKGLAGTPNSDNISYVDCAGDVRGGTWSGWTEIPGGGRTSHAPMVGTGPDINTLNVTITGENSTDLYIQTYDVARIIEGYGTGWASGWSLIQAFDSNAAPSLNTYWFPLKGGF